MSHELHIKTTKFCYIVHFFCFSTIVTVRQRKISGRVTLLRKAVRRSCTARSTWRTGLSGPSHGTSAVIERGVMLNLVSL